MRSPRRRRRSVMRTAKENRVAFLRELSKYEREKTGDRDRDRRGGRGNGMGIEVLQGRGRGAAPSLPGAAVAAAGFGGGGRRGGGEAGVPARTAWFGGGGGGDAMGCRDAANMISPDGWTGEAIEDGGGRTEENGHIRCIPDQRGGGNANFTTVLSFFPSYPAYDPLSFRGMATLIVVYVVNCALTVGPNQNISACSSTVTIFPPQGRSHHRQTKIFAGLGFPNEWTRTCSILSYHSQCSLLMFF